MCIFVYDLLNHLYVVKLDNGPYINDRINVHEQ